MKKLKKLSKDQLKIKQFNTAQNFRKRTQFGQLVAQINLILKYCYGINDRGITALRIALEYLPYLEKNKTSEVNAEQAVDNFYIF